MSDKNIMNHNNEIATSDSTSLGRRKLLQALAATGSAAVLGGLKLDLNWEAPFVEISHISAQAASTTTLYYTLEKQYAAAKVREDFLKQAEPTQAAKRKLIDTSTPGKDSPHVLVLGPSASGTWTMPSNGTHIHYMVNKGIAFLPSQNEIDMDFTFKTISNGKAGPFYPYINGTMSGQTPVDSDTPGKLDGVESGTPVPGFGEKTLGSTYSFIFTLSGDGTSSNKTYEMELGIGKDSDMLGVDKGNFVMAVMSLVELSN